MDVDGFVIYIMFPNVEVIIECAHKWSSGTAVEIVSIMINPSIIHIIEYWLFLIRYFKPWA